MRLVCPTTSNIINSTVNRSGHSRNELLIGDMTKKQIPTNIQMVLSILLVIHNSERQRLGLSKKSRFISLMNLMLHLKRDSISTSVTNSSSRKRAKRFYLTKVAPFLPSARWMMWNQSLVR